MAKLFIQSAPLVLVLDPLRSMAKRATYSSCSTRILIRSLIDVCASRVPEKDFIMLRKKAIAAVCGALLFTVTSYAQDKSIQPYKINVSEESLAELRRRIAATRWADRETVPDRSQGFQLQK